MYLGKGAADELLPTWFTRKLKRGAVGDDVARLREILGLPAGNGYDMDVVNAVRRYESGRQLPSTGIVDDLLALHLGE